MHHKFSRLFQSNNNQRYIILLIFLKTVFTYRWIEFNRRYDCIIGITVDDKPVSIGVFISSRTIITSANPLNEYLNSSDRIKIHTISKSYTKSVIRKVESVAGNQSFRKQTWVTIGYNDRTHTTIHDITLINVIESDKIDLTWVKDRKPFKVILPHDDSFIPSYQGWVFSGFGYIDNDHIKSNNILEYSFINNALVDCDEWIPREWGRFICLIDTENVAGLASGAPLFHDFDRRTLWGLGCFALKKDKEKLLVFTDLRPYVNKLYGYINDI